MSIIEQAAANPSVDVVKLSELLDMRERIVAKQAEASFNAAMVAMNQSGALRVKKNGKVDLPGKDGRQGGSYKFAKWEDMDLVLRPLLNSNGLWLSFDAGPRDGGGSVITATLSHVDGHKLTASMSLPLDSGPGRNNLQAMGSTLSYGKRYATELLLNIVREDEDDDGVSGGVRFVSHEDALEIDRLLTATNANRAGFMKHYGLRTILDLKATNAAVELRQLQSSLAKMQKEQTRQPQVDKLGDIDYWFRVLPIQGL